MKPKLTAREQVFAEEYLVDLNAKEAAIRAGYRANSAKVTGHRLLRKPGIAELVQELREKRAARTGITADRVLEEIGRLAFSDLRKVFDENGRLRPLSTLDDTAAAAIASLEVVTKTVPVGDEAVDIEHVHKIKVWDKPRSLELLARHLGMLKNDGEQPRAVELVMELDR